MLNPYDAPDPDVTPKRGLAKCGVMTSLCFATGSIGLPIGIVLVQATGFSLNPVHLALPVGVLVVMVSIVMLLFGVLRMSRPQDGRGRP